MTEKNPSFPGAKELLETFPKLGAEKAAELEKLLAAALVEGEEAIDDAMEKADKLIDGHGVEGIEGPDRVDRYWDKVVLLYVNLGETYETTLCYDTREEEFFLGSWGDFVEELEREDDEEEGEDDEEEEEEEGEGEESEEEAEEAD